MTGIFNEDTVNGSKLSAEVQAQHIMRSAADKIHDAFRELNRDSYANTGIFVMDVLREADNRLLRLVKECLIERYSFKYAPDDSQSS